MDTRIKNIIGIASFFAILFVIWGTYSYMTTYRLMSPRTFSVSGEGKVVAIPDIAKFTYTIITEGDKNLASSQEINAKQSEKVNAFLKNGSVKKEDIRTASYNVEPRYKYYDCIVRPQPAIYPGSVVTSSSACLPPEIIGYTVSITTEVKVRDLAKVGDLLSGTVKNGANSVSQLTFSLDDPDNAQNKARAEAVAKARAKAIAVAKAGGFRLGKLISINEGYAGPYYGRTYAEKAVTFDAMGSMPAPVPAIEAGSEDVIVNINLQYEIR